MSILKIEKFGTQKSAIMTLLLIDFDFPRFTRPIRVVREPSPLDLVMTKHTPENFEYMYLGWRLS